MRHLISFCAVSGCLLAPNAMAQANILGLPVVPQRPVQAAAQPAQQAAASAPASAASAAAKNAKQSASAARAAASGAKPSGTAAQDAVSNVEDKSVLSGGVTMASGYEGKLATVRVTTSNVYQGEVYRSQAIKAAKLVQRDLAIVCSWQCKPAPMPVPQILENGKLQFVMAIDNYPRVLSYDDMITMLMGRPLAVNPKPLATATAAPPVAAVSAAPAPPAAVSAAPATPAAPAANALPPGVVRSSNMASLTLAFPAQ